MSKCVFFFLGCRERHEGFLPVDIDRFRKGCFFDHVRFDMLEIVLVDINCVVLFDRVSDGLEQMGAVCNVEEKSSTLSLSLTWPSETTARP